MKRFALLSLGCLLVALLLFSCDMLGMTTTHGSTDQPREPFEGVYDHGDPSPHEQLMLEYINRARAAPGAEAARLGIDLNEGLAPGTISDTPKPPLSFNELLTRAARAHSRWMLDTGEFSHEGEGGSSAWDRILAVSYPLSGSWQIGENIAWGGSTCEIDIDYHTVARYEGLFRSPGHRRNILYESFDEIGLGVLDGLYHRNGNTFNAVMVTQKYALSAGTPGPRIVGVVYRDTNANAFYDIGEGVAGVTVRITGSDTHAVTSSSGGYALPYSGDSGPIAIEFSGGTLPLPVVVEIEATGKNAKLDLETSGL